MRKVLKWIGIGVGVIVGLLIVIIAVVAGLGYQKLTNSQQFHVSETFTAPTSSDAVARGAYLVNSTAGCTGCHGDGFKGAIFIDAQPIGLLVAPNLSTGKGGIGGQMTDADWNRAIRHGIGHDGRVLVIMPADNFTHLSDADLGAIIAYLKSLPPADNVLPARKLGFLAYVFVGAGVFPLPAQNIDHSAAHVASVAPAETADYGHYIVAVAGCRTCHGPNLTGGTPGQGGGPPVGPNISPTGEEGPWTKAQFINTIRTGTNPAGQQLSDQMPWTIFKNMTDQDLGAVYDYLHSLPGK
jgi:mono/diheme cytochrome c family protein